MCPPGVMFIASMALSVAENLMIHRGQQQVANNQYDAQVRYNEQLEENARIAALAQYEAATERQREEVSKRRTELSDANLRKLRAQGTARAAAGGTTGVSVDALLADYEHSYNRYRGLTIENQRIVNNELQREMRLAHAQQRSNVNRYAQVTPVPQPSFTGTLARVGGDAFSAYNRYSDRWPGGRRTLRFS